MTLEERIENQINEMKRIQKDEQLIRNQDEQNLAHNKFLEVVKNTQIQLNSLVYAKKEFSFQLSSEIIQQLKDIVKLEQEEANNSRGFLSIDHIRKIEENYRKTSEKISAEWKISYRDTTGQLLGALRVINKVFSKNEVKTMIDLLEKGKTWDHNIQRLKVLKETKEGAHKIYTTLNLDRKILEFLNNTSQNRTSLADLNDEILSWIKDNNLEKSFRLKFLS